MKYCQNCGYQLDRNASYCEKCGFPCAENGKAYQPSQPSMRTVQGVYNAARDTSAYEAMLIRQKTHGTGVAGFVLSLLGLLSAWFLIGGLFGLLGLIFSLVSSSDMQRIGEPAEGIAIAGIVLGILSIVASICFFFFYFAFLES